MQRSARVARFAVCPLFGVVAILFLATPLLAQPTVVPRILNGTPTSEFEAVGIVGNLDRGGFCTGTLITPTHVLTAAHCAEEIELEPTEGTFELDGSLYFTRAVFIHPDYNPFNLDSDVAVLELEEAVVGVTPDVLFRQTPMVGEVLTLVGYGQGGDGDGASGVFGTKRRGTTDIEEVTPTQIRWTFDSNDESNTAPGDSGGPGYLIVNGAFQIASITSGGSRADAGIGDEAFNVRVDAFASWIDSVTSMDEPQEEPGEEPEEEPQEEPSEEPGEEPQEEPGEEPQDEPGEEPQEEPTEEPQEEPTEEEEEDDSHCPQIGQFPLLTFLSHFAFRPSQWRPGSFWNGFRPAAQRPNRRPGKRGNRGAKATFGLGFGSFFTPSIHVPWQMF